MIWLEHMISNREVILQYMSGKGLSTLDIMHLGGWEDLSMVLKHARSIRLRIA